MLTANASNNIIYNDNLNNTDKTLTDANLVRSLSPDSQLSVANDNDEQLSSSSDSPANSSNSNNNTKNITISGNTTPENDGHDSMSSANSFASSNGTDNSIPCSAISAYERDMPNFDYTPLIHQLRELILDNIEQNPGLYGHNDVLRCKTDDFYLGRFLLRHKCNLEDAFEQLKRTMRYHNEMLCSLIKPEDFPEEFYQLGGTFNYEPDRRGNVTMYMRVKVHRKTPEIKAVVESFLYYNLLRTDELAQGKGITVVMDCTGGGLQSADIELLFFFVSSLRNYFPKGLSYILVHNLPWILKPFWHLAKAWIPEEHKELIKFSNDKTIFEYIERENLPDFMGGTCKRSYRQAPDNCTNLQEAIKFWGLDIKVARSVLGKFRENLPEDVVMRTEKALDDLQDLMNSESNDNKVKREQMVKTPDILKSR